MTSEDELSKIMKTTVQRTLQKMKFRKTAQEYKRLNPTGSCLRKLYRLAKLHRMLEDLIIDNFAH